MSDPKTSGPNQAAQLSFDLTIGTAHPRRLEELIYHEGNRLALDYLFKNPPKNPYPAILLGPPAVGKTALSRVWATYNNALVIHPDSHLEDVLTKGAQAIVVDAIEDWLGSPPPHEMEQRLFHLFNHCTQTNTPLLLSARASPHKLDFALPDLASRLKACVTLPLKEPNDADRSIFLAKFFSDFQLSVDGAILTTIITHGPRNVQAMKNLVVRVHERICQTKKKISLPLVRQVVREYQFFNSPAL